MFNAPIRASSLAIPSKLVPVLIAGSRCRPVPLGWGSRKENTWHIAKQSS